MAENGRKWPNMACNDSVALNLQCTAPNLHLNCTNLLVGTISFRSLGENILVGTFAFLHSDHWADISLSVHWAEISLCQHRLIEQLNSPCSIQMHGCPGKTGSILCFSMVIKKCNNNSMCRGRFHSRTTLSGSRYQGRTPPNVGARTPCPKAKARAGSNTRHGLPHSTCTLLTSGPASPHLISSSCYVIL